MNGDRIRVNGNVLSWGSLVAKIDGHVLFGWTVLNYEQAREREHVWGMGAHQAPQGRTRGKYTPGPVAMTGRKSSVAALKQHLADKSGIGSYGDAEFDIVLQGVEEDETPITVVISRCVITKVTANHQEGSEALAEDLEISCMSIRENGLTLFDATRDGSPD